MYRLQNNNRVADCEKFQDAMENKKQNIRRNQTEGRRKNKLNKNQTSDKERTKQY